MKLNVFLISTLLFICLGLGWSCTVCGQDAVQPPAVVYTVEAERPFHRQVIRSAVEASKKPDSGVSRRDVIRLRVAMLSPAFREHAEQLAVTQLFFNGSDVPMNEDGTVAMEEIKWDSAEWMAFLEKLVPILLMLLRMFAK